MGRCIEVGGDGSFLSTGGFAEDFPGLGKKTGEIFVSGGVCTLRNQVRAC